MPLDAYNDSLARGLFIRNRLERDLAHERQLGDSMVIFADRAIPAFSPLSHWYAIGRALGDFRQRAQRETADALAPLRPVAEAARGVGQEHLGRVPDLNELVGLVNRPEGETEPGLRHAFVARIGLVGPFDDLAPWPASPFIAVPPPQVLRDLPKPRAAASRGLRVSRPRPVRP